MVDKMYRQRVLEFLNRRSEEFVLVDYAMGFDVLVNLPGLGERFLPFPSVEVDDAQLTEMVDYQIGWFTRSVEIGIDRRMITPGIELPEIIERVNHARQGWTTGYAFGVTAETLESWGWKRTATYGEMFLPILNQAGDLERRGYYRAPTIAFKPHPFTRELEYGKVLIALKLMAIVQTCQGYLPEGISAQNLHTDTTEFATGVFTVYASQVKDLAIAGLSQVTQKHVFDVFQPIDLSAPGMIEDLGLWHLIDCVIFRSMRSAMEAVEGINRRVTAHRSSLEPIRRQHQQDHPTDELNAYRYDCRDNRFLGESLWSNAPTLIGLTLPDYNFSYRASCQLWSQIMRALWIRYTEVEGLQILGDNTIAILVAKQVSSPVEPCSVVGE